MTPLCEDEHKLLEKSYRFLEDIKGLYIIDIKLSPDSALLYINLKNDSDGLLFLEYSATSCGGYNAWITELNGNAEVIGQKVIDIIEHSMDAPSYGNDYGVLYNIEICTQKGTCTIDFRTDCNGYYGGMLELHLGRRLLPLNPYDYR
jgi:hypothetical protein